MAQAPKTKTQAVAEYRRQISGFLKSVMAQEGWNMKEVGAVMGVSRWTISRALEGTHTIDYLALLALSERVKVPLPNELLRAARTLKEPVIHPDTKPEVRAFIEDVLIAPDDVQKALFEELAKKYGASA
jgi:transcriptional regulator with XRE-family HTH domain